MDEAVTSVGQCKKAVTAFAETTPTTPPTRLMMVVGQFLLPMTTCPHVETEGETPCKFCAFVCRALMSSIVGDCNPEAYNRSPPLTDTLLLGRKLIMFNPVPANYFSMLCFEPSPMATIEITAFTPMVMPSMVKNARNLLCKKARTAYLEEVADVHIQFLIVVRALNRCRINYVAVTGFFIHYFFPCLIDCFGFDDLYLRINFMFSTIVHHLLCFGDATD